MISITVSALGPTIAEQIAAQGCTPKLPAEQADRLEHAIHLLRIRGLLTDQESDRAMKRLLKEVQPLSSTTAPDSELVGKGEQR